MSADDLPIWLSYTPTIYSSTGTINTYSINYAAYKEVGAYDIELLVDFTINDNGTGAGFIAMNLPVRAAQLSGGPHSQTVGVGADTIGNKLLSSQVNDTELHVFLYDGTYPCTAPFQTFVCNASYQRLLPVVFG